MTSSPFTTPSPPQWVHFFLMTVPRPPQVGHTEAVCICPKKLLTVCTTWPRPWQVGQVSVEPSSEPLPWQCVHATYLLTLIFFFVPWAISCRLSFTFTRRLEPRCLTVPPRLPPPKPPKPLKPPPPKSKPRPNTLFRMSLRSKSPKPPKPPPPLAEPPSMPAKP